MDDKDKQSFLLKQPQFKVYQHAELFNGIQKKPEEGELLMGGILDGDGEDDILALRNSAKSAPPDLYLQQKASLQQQENDYLYTKDYFDYYKQSNNPRLQKPLYRHDQLDIKSLNKQMNKLSIDDSTQYKQSITNAELIQSIGNSTPPPYQQVPQMIYPQQQQIIMGQANEIPPIQGSGSPAPMIMMPPNQMIQPPINLQQPPPTVAQNFKNPPNHQFLQQPRPQNQYNKYNQGNMQHQQGIKKTKSYQQQGFQGSSQQNMHHNNGQPFQQPPQFLNQSFPMMFQAPPPNLGAPNQMQQFIPLGMQQPIQQFPYQQNMMFQQQGYGPNYPNMNYQNQMSMSYPQNQNIGNNGMQNNIINPQNPNINNNSNNNNNLSNSPGNNNNNQINGGGINNNQNNQNNINVGNNNIMSQNMGNKNNSQNYNMQNNNRNQQGMNLGGKKKQLNQPNGHIIQNQFMQSNQNVSNNNPNQVQNLGKSSSTDSSNQNFNQLFPDLIESCKDQNSSRTIQKQFENSTIEEKNKIFERIQPEALNLMKDQFGNYVIQKLFEKGTIEHKEKLYYIIKGNVEQLSLHTYGCRVIQKALEELKERPQMQEGLIQELNNKIMTCIQDQNGNHVIQKCFETLSSSKLTTIINEVIQNIEELAFHPYGCRVIQRILEFCSNPETKKIYEKLMTNLIRLCECQYGNYIIQYIIEKGQKLEKDEILQVVKVHFVDLSLNKFASNVTEKSIVYSDEEFKAGVLDVLLRPNNQNHLDTGIVRLTKNAFGNYVVQRLYEKAQHETKLRVCQYLLQNNDVYNEVISNSFGKHVLSYIEKHRVDIPMNQIQQNVGNIQNQNMNNNNNSGPMNNNSNNNNNNNYNNNSNNNNGYNHHNNNNNNHHSQHHNNQNNNNNHINHNNYKKNYNSNNHY
ncbi:pumilio-family RNA-binding repeatprotein (macronuclear) [Tetrahymena thermophila SB210]|uniref:Pumilio-family RNA-binding repeatprotein n=1 Tax=Tetrahymena thermophila (strain SB210) TaxID=312017 RepID=I7LWM5_TETTS|nr:pumilio-family RNA-binding repeatprotein [Tetrahymena thermophila SB210]EAS02166.2 pumilio-family RNA-binding repeatprotein [Tetrahymena thermophila SB210]|eukprot:XP_001022411.2 pumilio-family RNA-binding repeatprotein [Tetrahymena thermophila SB210]